MQLFLQISAGFWAQVSIAPVCLFVAHFLLPSVSTPSLFQGPDPGIPSTNDPCHKSRSPARKPDRRKTARSQPSSPDPKPGLQRALKSCSSFPPPGAKRLSSPVGVSRMASQKLTHSPAVEVAYRKSNAVTGVTVLMVSFAFLMLWGRICAILCMSTWFYFVPRLRGVIHTGGDAGENDGGEEVDVDSSEYKKKVIMAGLLHRNRR